MDDQSINPSRIEDVLISNRLNDRRSLAVFLNSGDPTLEITQTVLKQCAFSAIDIIELGIPFPESYTDGDIILRSHDRALNNHVVFEDVIRLVSTVRETCNTPIVLLLDYSFTVIPRGIKYVVEQCRLCGADGLLMHGLPPLFYDEYLEYTGYYGIDPILSLYPRTPHNKIAYTLEHAKGFVYLVTQYGKSGAKVDFCSNTIHCFFDTIRKSTNIPLLAGFGIKSLNDLRKVFSNSSIDGAIVGSSICHVIETSLPNLSRIRPAIKKYLQSIIQAKEMTYENRNRKMRFDYRRQSRHRPSGCS